ncbi:MAG TPA: hypothetical protein VIU64_10925 [Polyangia bacterium]
MKAVDGPPSDLRARILRVASRTPSTRPGTWPRRVLGAGTFAVLWTLAAAALVRARSDWGELPVGSLALTFAVLLAVAGAALGAGLTRGRAMAGPPLERLLVVVAVGLTALLALVLAVDPGGPSTRQLSGAALWWHSLPCAALELGVGLPLVVAVLVPFAGLSLARPGLTGACVGLAAATLAHAVVRFHCGVGGSDHALLGHLLPGVPLMLLGAWFSAARVVERSLERIGRARQEKSEEEPEE